MPEKPAAKILRCWPAMRKIGMFLKIAMRNACDSDSHCGLACDASARDAKSLAMWVERCEPLRTGGFPYLDLSFLFCPFLSFPDFSGIFPICSGMVRGVSRFVLFLFLGLLRAPTRNSPERVRDTIWRNFWRVCSQFRLSVRNFFCRSF